MLVGDLMTREPVTVSPDTPVADVVDLLLDRGINGVPVVDASGAVWGMVTTGDLVHRLADERVDGRASFWRESFYKSVFRPSAPEPNPAEGATAGEVMSRDPAYVTPVDDMAVAARLLVQYRVKSLPVLEEGRLVGMISRIDLLRCLRENPDCCNPLKRQV